MNKIEKGIMKPAHGSYGIEIGHLYNNVWGIKILLGRFHPYIGIERS